MYQIAKSEEYRETELGELPVERKVEKFEGYIIKKRIKVGKVQQQKYKTVGKFPIVDQEKNKKKALKELFKSMLYNLMSAKIIVKGVEVK